MIDMSSVDSQLYDWWLFEEASLERDKRNTDVCSHHRRVQLIILDTWRHTTQFVMSDLLFDLYKIFSNLDFLYKLLIN